MFGGSILEKYFTSLVQLGFDERATFLTEELDLWYHGGIEDMATNVAWKWTQLTQILDSKVKPKALLSDVV